MNIQKGCYAGRTETGFPFSVHPDRTAICFTCCERTANTGFMICIIDESRIRYSDFSRDILPFLLF